jgi:Holliday junction resolvase RusA-like endonuclease
MTQVSFAVRSTPVTQGSFRVFHKRGATTCITNLVSDNDAKLKVWRRLVKTAGRNAMKGRPPFDRAVQVLIIFWFARPKSHAGETWAAVNGRNDLEKLVRSCHDAITEAGVWKDDGLVARIETEKRWCSDGERPGVDVTVEAL